MSESVWYVIQSNPREEAVATEALAQRVHNVAGEPVKGYTVWLPFGKEEGKPAKALFMGYLFVRIVLDEDWWPIMSTRGVSNIITNMNLVPVPVSEAVIAELRSRLAPGTDHVEIASTDRKRDYKRDDRVKIHQWDDATNEAGPFHNLDALFVALRGGRAEIVLDIAGRAAKVTIDVNALVDTAPKT